MAENDGTGENASVETVSASAIALSPAVSRTRNAICGGFGRALGFWGGHAIGRPARQYWKLTGGGQHLEGAAGRGSEFGDGFAGYRGCRDSDRTAVFAVAPTDSSGQQPVDRRGRTGQACAHDASQRRAAGH